MSLTITFFNRSGTLYVRINMGASNKKVERSCGVEIGPLEVDKHPDGEGGYICRVNGYTAPARKANRFIQQWEERFSGATSPEEALLLWESGNSGGAETVVQFLPLFYEYIRKHGNGWAGSTLKSFQHTYEKYKAYCAGDDFNIFARDIKALPAHKRRPLIADMQEHWEGYAEYLSEALDHSPGTVYLFMTKLSSVIKYVNDNYGVEIPFISLPKNANYEAKKVDWPDWVIQKLLALPNTDFNPVFKAQVWTTLRISDIFSLSEENFEKISVGDRNIWRIVNVNQKNNTQVAPALPENLALILLANIQKYGHVVPAQATNLPTYNRKLKEAVRLITSKERISVVNDAGKQESIELWRTASSHQLRKEGINLYERAGFDSSRIRRLFSGHKSESTYVKHYQNGLRVESLVEFSDFQDSFGN